MNTEERLQAIRNRLTDAFEPSELEVIDEGHLHKGHVGARDGRGHFRVTIRADAFAGRRKMQVHRAIYAALGELMQTEIHALAIHAMPTHQPESTHD